MATDHEHSTGPEKLPRGAYSKIARRMRPQVTPQHVREVHLGMAVSARVSRAIERYKASIGLETVATDPEAHTRRRLAS